MERKNPRIIARNSKYWTRKTRTDLEYKNKIEELELKITEQTKEIGEKDNVITKAQDDVKLMGTAISKYKKKHYYEKENDKNQWYFS